MSTLRSVKRSTERVIGSGAACLILGGLLLAGCQPTAPVDDNPPTQAPATWFADGGANATHLAPGAYVTTVPPAKSKGEPDSCYYEVFTDWERTQRRANGFGSEGDSLTIHILPGDTWVNSTGCGQWELVATPNA